MKLIMRKITITQNKCIKNIKNTKNIKNIKNTKNIENIGQGLRRLGKTLVTRTRTHPKPVQYRS